MTSAAEIHAMVARALASPGAPATSAIPHERIRLFGAFLTKVRHNAIRGEMPRTLDLLKQLGVEIAFFASYGTHFDELRHARATKRERLSAFAEAVQRYAKDSQLWHLCAVARHEHLCWEIEEVDSPPRTRTRRLSRAPTFHIERYEVDPRTGIESAVFLSYHHIGSGEQAVVRALHDAAVLLFAALDGTRTLAQSVSHILRVAGGGDAEAIRAFYIEAMRDGLVVAA